jgi:hypothetical protein
LKKDLKSTKVCGVFYDFINGNKLCLPWPFKNSSIDYVVVFNS